MSRFFTAAPRIYYKHGCTPLCIRELIQQDERKRFLILAPTAVVNASIPNKVASTIINNGAEYFIHAVLEDTCNDAAIESALAVSAAFKPDCIVSVGGGSTISLGKFVWDKLAGETTIRRNPAIYNVAIPTTTGSGAEVTPFAVKIVDGVEVTVSKPSLVPHMSICDPVWSMNLGNELTAKSAVHAAANAVEAVLSPFISDYILPFAVGSLKLVKENLAEVLENNEAVRAREHLTNAAMMAGIAHANLESAGSVHILLSSMRSVFGVSYGVAAAVVVAPLIQKVIANLDALRADFVEDGFNTPEKLVEMFNKVVEISGLETSRKALGEMTEAEYTEKVKAVVANWTCADITAADVEAILMSA